MIRCDHQPRAMAHTSSGSRWELSGEGGGYPVDDLGRPTDHEEVAPFRSGAQRQPVRLQQPSWWVIDPDGPLRSWETDIGLVDVDPAPLSIVIGEERCRKATEIHIPTRPQRQTGSRDLRSGATRGRLSIATILILDHRGLDRWGEVGPTKECKEARHGKEQRHDRRERMPHADRAIRLDETRDLQHLHQ